MTTSINFSISLTSETLKALDRKRDLIPRSSYIERVLVEHLKKSKGVKN